MMTTRRAHERGHADHGWLNAGHPFSLDDSHSLQSGRHASLHIAEGEVEVNGQRLASGDGAAVAEENQLSLKASKPSQVLLFDLA